MHVDTETGLILHRGWLTRSAAAVRALQATAVFFGFIYCVLALRFVLTYFMANTQTGFARLVWQLSGPFYVPFQGLFASSSDGAGHPLELPLLVAIAVYALVHYGVRRAIFALAASPRT